MLVLAPTRELASQIAASAEAYGKYMRLSVGVIFGGVPNRKSVRTVARGLDVLVATPGRLLDLIDQRALSLRELEILVLDEADQMLDLGFIHALKRIVASSRPSARPCSSRPPCRARSRNWPTNISATRPKCR